MSDHFSLAEMSFSVIAARMSIDNTPPKRVLTNLTKTVEKLEEIRTLLGDRPMHVNSAYRCEELEKIICVKQFTSWCYFKGLGVTPHSWKRYFMTRAHPLGYAADFTCNSFGDPSAIVKAIIGSGITFDYVFAEDDWVHISFDPKLRGLTSPDDL
jgi:hypothetical protein